MMKKRVHLLAAITAISLVAAFMLATVAAELSGDKHLIFMVKTGVLCAIPVLIASIITTGVLGRSMAAGSDDPIFRRKRRRLAIIAPIGLFVLVPCAVALWYLASAGKFGGLFIVLQSLELAGGMVNLALLSLNARDGWRLSHNLM